MFNWKLNTAIAVIAFSVGWYFNGLRWETKFYDLSLTLSTQVKEAQQKVVDAERTIAVLTASVEKEVSEHEEQIDTDYHGLLANIDNDSVYKSDYRTDRPTLPADATTSCPVCPCDDQCYADSRRSFRELRKTVLAYTKKCDEIAAKYNGLIMFYNSVRNEVNKSQ